MVGSTVKSTGWSSSGSGFNYQHHLLDSQPPITPVPGDPMPYGLCGAPGTCMGQRHTCKKTLIHLKVKVIKNNFLCVVLPKQRLMEKYERGKTKARRHRAVYKASTNSGEGTSLH